MDDGRCLLDVIGDPDALTDFLDNPEHGQVAAADSSGDFGMCWSPTALLSAAEPDSTTSGLDEHLAPITTTTTTATTMATPNLLYQQQSTHPPTQIAAAPISLPVQPSSVSQGMVDRSSPQVLQVAASSPLPTTARTASPLVRQIMAQSSSPAPQLTSQLPQQQFVSQVQQQRTFGQQLQLLSSAANQQLTIQTAAQQQQQQQISQTITAQQLGQPTLQIGHQLQQQLGQAMAVGQATQQIAQGSQPLGQPAQQLGQIGQQLGQPQTLTHVQVASQQLQQQAAAARGQHMQLPNTVLAGGNIVNLNQIQPIQVRPQTPVNVAQGSMPGQVSLQGTLIQTSTGNKILIQSQPLIGGQQINLAALQNLQQQQNSTTVTASSTLPTATPGLQTAPGGAPAGAPALAIANMPNIQGSTSGTVTPQPNINFLNLNAGQGTPQIVIQRTPTPGGAPNQNIILRAMIPSNLIQIQAPTGTPQNQAVTQAGQTQVLVAQPPQLPQIQQGQVGIGQPQVLGNVNLVNSAQNVNINILPASAGANLVTQNPQQIQSTDHNSVGQGQSTVQGQVTQSQGHVVQEQGKTLFQSQIAQTQFQSSQAQSQTVNIVNSHQINKVQIQKGSVQSSLGINSTAQQSIGNLQKLKGVQLQNIPVANPQMSQAVGAITQTVASSAATVGGYTLGQNLVIPNQTSLSSTGSTNTSSSSVHLVDALQQGQQRSMPQGAAGQPQAAMSSVSQPLILPNSQYSAANQTAQPIDHLSQAAIEAGIVGPMSVTQTTPVSAPPVVTTAPTVVKKVAPPNVVVTQNRGFKMPTSMSGGQMILPKTTITTSTQLSTSMKPLPNANVKSIQPRPPGVSLQSVQAPPGVNIQNVQAPPGVNIQNIQAPPNVNIQNIQAPPNVNIQNIQLGSLPQSSTGGAVQNSLQNTSIQILPKPVSAVVTVASTTGTPKPTVSPSTGPENLPKVQTIQLTPASQNLLQRIQNQIKPLLAIQNRTEHQQKSLQKLLLAQQKVLSQAPLQTIIAPQQQQPISAGVQSSVAAPSTAVASSATQLIVTNNTIQSAPQPGVVTIQPQTAQQQIRLTTSRSNAATQPATGFIQLKPILPAKPLQQIQANVTNIAVATTTVTFSTATAPTAAKLPIPGGQQVKVVNQIQLPADFKEKLQAQLSKLKPEQQQQLLKQPTLLLKLYQQQVLKQQAAGNVAAGKIPITVQQVAKGVKPVKILPQPGSTGAFKRPAPPQPISRAALMQQRLTRDQTAAVQPDCKTPFKNKKDTIKRLLRYHVFQSREPPEEEVLKDDEAYEKLAQDLMEKKQQMLNKFRLLLYNDSMHEVSASEKVMLERIFIQDEREQLNKDKKMASEDPESFVPTPILTADSPGVSGPTSPVQPTETTGAGSNQAAEADSKENVKRRRLDSSPEKSDYIKTESEDPSTSMYTLHASSGLKLVFKNSPSHIRSPAHTPDALKENVHTIEVKPVGADISVDNVNRKPNIPELIAVKTETVTDNVKIKKEPDRGDSDLPNHGEFYGNGMGEDFTGSDEPVLIKKEPTEKLPFQNYLGDTKEDMQLYDSETGMLDTSAITEQDSQASDYTSSQEEGEMSEADAAVAGLLSSTGIGGLDYTGDDQLGTSSQYSDTSDVEIIESTDDIPHQKSMSRYEPSVDDISDSESSFKKDDELDSATSSIFSQMNYDTAIGDRTFSKMPDLSSQEGELTGDKQLLGAANSPFSDPQFDEPESLNLEMQSAINSILSLQQPGIPNNPLEPEESTYSGSCPELTPATYMDTDLQSCENEAAVNSILL